MAQVIPPDHCDEWWGCCGREMVPSRPALLTYRKNRLARSRKLSSMGET